MEIVRQPGLYSITGLFRSRTMGSYRAFATNPANAVVLQLPGRTVVITPSDPAGFLTALTATGYGPAVAAGAPEGH